MDDLAVMLEAVLYERAANALVEHAQAARHAGVSREEILCDVTAMLREGMADHPGKLASMSAMLVVLESEKR